MCGTKATAPQPLPGKSRSRRSRPQTQSHPAPDNEEYRRVQQARRDEIEGRKFRNHMRRMRFLFKGAEPSTSPFCLWVNDPFESEELPPDWQPPPKPPPLPDKPPC
jgi:hypothetical protein